MAISTTQHIQVDFFFLDLETCTRCRTADSALVQALELTRPVLEAAGIGVSVAKVLVTDERQAREHGFVSSPTIRINGIDIAGRLVESSCDACTELCACKGGIDCRDWVWRGQRSTEPPVGLIVEAIMAQAFGGRLHQEAASPGEGGPAPSTRLYEVPENLSRFFASRAAASRTADEADHCCGPAEQASCCEPEAKEACCGATADASAACGCR